MVTYLPRSAWDARPSRGATPLAPAGVDGVAIHWPGMTNPLGRDRVAAALRGWQDYHMDSRGWSDIAYQVAVDQWGRAWTLRGLTTRSAANGDRAVNERFGAILLILAPGEEPGAAMKAATREVVADFRRLFVHGTRIVPHSLIRPEPTDCPGDPARAAIRRGDFEPVEDDMQFSDVVPNYTDPDGSVLKVGEALPRGAKAYELVFKMSERIDGMQRALDALDQTPADASTETRVAALEAFAAKLRQALV